MIELGGFPIETERKWILRSDTKIIKAPDTTYLIHQKYALDGWRYREQSEVSGFSIRNGIDTYHDPVYYKTKKTPVGKGANEEEEYVISKEEYENCGPIKSSLSKFRRVYKIDDLKFEVDIFLHIHLVILEVELRSLDQEFDMPDFLQKLIIYEVTGIKEFNNSSLSSVVF